MIYGTIYSRASSASLLGVIDLSRVFTECPGYKQGLYILEIVKLTAPLKLLFPFLFFFTWPLGVSPYSAQMGTQSLSGLMPITAAFFFFCKAPHTFFFLTRPTNSGYFSLPKE